MDYCVGNGQLHQGISKIVGSLNCMHDQQIVLRHVGGGDEMNDVSTAVRRLTPL